MCQVSGCRAVNRKGFQDSEMTRANRVRTKCIMRQGHKGERNVKEKEFQKITQSTTVTGRRSCLDPISFSLSFYASLGLQKQKKHVTKKDCLREVYDLLMSIKSPVCYACPFLLLLFSVRVQKGRGNRQ